MQPVVTLAADGQSAKGRWHIMAMLGGYGTSASWAGGVYENQYIRENGVWKFKEVRYHLAVLGSLSKIPAGHRGRAGAVSLRRLACRQTDSRR
jgi:hypothetical protein